MSIFSTAQNQTRSELQPLFLETERVLLLEPPGTEAELNAYRVELLSIERRLAEVSTVHSDCPDLAFYRAQVADKLNHPKDSIPLWLSLKAQLQATLDEVNFTLGTALQRTSDLDSALGCINGVSREFPRQAELKTLKAKVNDELSILASVGEAEAVVELAAQRAPLDRAQPLIRSSLEKSRLSYRGDARILSILERTYAAVAAMPATPAPTAKAYKLRNYRVLRRPTNFGERTPNVIFTCGFLWSGSGAVTAMLSGYSGIEIALGGREVNLFQQNTTLMGMLDKPEGSLGPRQLMYLMIGPIAGLLVERRRLFVNRAKSLVKAQVDCKGGIVELLASCNRFIDRIEALRSCPQEDLNLKTLTLVRDLATESISSLHPGGDGSIVMNNSIFGFHIRHLALFANAAAVTVKRDPRDQYVSQVHERRREDVPPLGVFIRDTRRRLDEHDRSVKALELSDRVVEVRFEEFVTKQSVRDQVLERLNIDPTRQRGVSGFDPSKSSKNIGIHKKFGDRAAIKQIEQAFPELLY